MEFGVWLKQKREEKGFSTRELSDRIGKSSSYVSQLERGTTKVPSPSVAKMLFHELGIEDIEEIMEQWEITTKKDRLLSVLGMDKELDRNHLEREMLKELEVMDIEEINAFYSLLKRQKDVLINLYALEQTGNRQAMSGLRDYLDFLVGRYVINSKNQE